MTIYEYHNYKPFLADLIQSMPRKGHGQARRLAEHLSVNSVVISQILKGTRDFTPEQGLRVSAYFGFDESATEYFVNLINKERAGTAELSKYYESLLNKMRKEQQKLKTKMAELNELSDEDKSIYYSNWYYSGIRLLSALPGFDNVEAIAKHFGLSRTTVAQVVTWMVSRNLLTDVDGKIQSTLRTTFIDSTSKHINNHRRNWRLKALEKITEPGVNDTFGSFVYTLSAEDILQIKKEIAEMIARVSKRVKDSPEEKIACLNIDWFEF